MNTTIEEIEKSIEELIHQINGMMLRMRNGYLEHGSIKK